MTKLLELTPKDPQRGFDELQRFITYSRDNKKSQVCRGEVLWVEAQIHHVDQHPDGGKTESDNGALVQSACHPLSAAAVNAFAAKWKRSKQRL